MDVCTSSYAQFFKKLNSYLLVFSHNMPKLRTFFIIPTVTLSSISFARNLGVLFDSNLSLYDHIASIIKSCLFNLRDLRRLRHILDQTTAHNIATALIHSKLDYCNSHNS